MILSLAGAAICVLIAYIWLTRGFFSALIHFVCTVIAGALAFSFWEPIAMGILKGTDGTGFLPSSAWAIALGLPFALFLAIIRPIVDRIIRANVSVNSALDYAGGGILGLASGAISVGILMISVSHLRVDYTGSQVFEYGGAGSVERSSGFRIPFDRAVVGFYGHLSQRSFRTDTPLAQWSPAAHEIGYASRISPFDGAGRNAFRPDDFEVSARFTVGEGKSDFSALTRDRWNPNPQPVTDAAGEPFPAGTHIEGFVVRFKAGSKEKDGQTAVGAAQVQLLLENANGEQMLVFPFAVSSQATPETPGVARWRFDAPDVFIATVGGASESPFAFEFPNPPGFTPKALYVKGIRHNVADGATAQPRFKFGSAAERDAGISQLTGASLAAGSMGAATPTAPSGPVNGPGGLDLSGVTPIGDGRGWTDRLPDGLTASVRLPWGLTLQKGQHGFMELDEEANKNIILNGSLELNIAEMPTGLTEKAIKIEQFLADSTTVLVQMEVSASSRTSILGGAITAAENVLPPFLVDTLGERYQPVGFVYKDESTFKLRFTPGDPITSMSQLPTLSRSRPTQKMVLLFRVSKGRSVQYFTKGTKVIAEFKPPYELRDSQMNR